MVAVVAAAIALIGGRIGGKSAAAERGERHSELWEKRQQRVGGESAAGFANMERIRSRTAPALTVSPSAVTAAQAQASALPLIGPAWSEITRVPYNSDAKGFEDPVWSNSGGGAGNVGGLVRGIAIKPGLIFISADSGGVWRSSDGGAHWTAVGDSLPTLSTGDIEVNPADGSLWVGTGAPDSYVGQGVWRSTDNGGHWTRVGGTELAGTVTGKIAFDGHGMAIVANSQGVFRHDSTTTAGAWSRSTITPTPTPWPYGLVFANDIQIRPGSNGTEIVASIAWRGGSPYDGFYLSTDGGASFNRLAVTGSINDHDIRRSSFAYSSDGKKLYALVQSASLYDTARMQGNTTLNGIYVSSTGNAVGPWSKVAEYRKLQNAGSAFESRPYAKGYSPGVQAWYNQFIKVDPADPNHVYLGLEEVYETTDGGNHWHTIGPYWNFSLPCYAGGRDNCPPTTHPDQHAIAIANGTVYVGNDGGLYTRPLHNATGWANLNSGMNTLLYYYAGSGKVAGGDAVWGGMQDNGTSLLLPGATEQVSPFGGDGGDVLIDPNNGNRAVVEYVDLTMALTTNGGRSNGTTLAFTEMSPSCFASDPTAACDPNPRFIAPFTADVTNIDHWVAGGEFVWDNGGKGWNTRCNSSGCDWTKAYDTGAGHSVTALAVKGSTTYRLVRTL